MHLVILYTTKVNFLEVLYRDKPTLVILHYLPIPDPPQIQVKLVDYKALRLVNQISSNM